MFENCAKEASFFVEVTLCATRRWKALMSHFKNEDDAHSRASKLGFEMLLEVFENLKEMFEMYIYYRMLAEKFRNV